MLEDDKIGRWTESHLRGDMFTGTMPKGAAPAKSRRLQDPADSGQGRVACTVVLSYRYQTKAVSKQPRSFFKQVKGLSLVRATKQTFCMHVLHHRHIAPGAGQVNITGLSTGTKNPYRKTDRDQAQIFALCDTRETRRPPEAEIRTVSFLRTAAG